MEKYAHPMIAKLMTINENKFCFDCGVVSPKWASVNNGIFLCLKCAGIHRGFGVHISFVRSLTMDNWDQTQILFLVNGGNARLSQIFQDYNISYDIDISIKYFLNAVEYHRKLLRYEVKGGELPKKPNSTVGLMKMEVGYNRNFDNNNNLISSSNNDDKDDIIQQEGDKSKKNTFFGKIGSFFDKTKENIETKFKEMKIAEKAKDIAKTTKNFVQEKSKDIMNSNVVKKVVTKTKDIFNIKEKEGEANINYENHQEVYPFEGSYNNVNINQPEARVNNSFDEPDFGNIKHNVDQNRPNSHNDVLDEIHKSNDGNDSNHEKKEEMNNFFKDDDKNISNNQDKKYEYPKFY